MHPAIAAAGFAVLDHAAEGGGPPAVLSGAALEAPDLLEGMSAVELVAPAGAGWRFGQGRVHAVGVVLVLVTAAILAGKRSLSGIAGWVADVDAQVLGALYRSAPGGDDGRLRAPSRSVIRRVLVAARGDQVDAVAGAWLAGRAEITAAEHHDGAAAAAVDVVEGASGLFAVAVDGKYLRGAADPVTGGPVIMMAAATHEASLVLGQVQIDAKSNEIPAFAPLLLSVAAAGIDLSGAVITADALHCQRAHATWLSERGMDYVFTAKGNQAGLFAAIDALTWDDVPIAHTSVDVGHGRHTTRTIRVLPAPVDLPFPAAAQVALIEREIRDPTTLVLTSAVAALIVTSLSAERAGPTAIAALVRQHWRIEALHWIRDVVFAEDANRTRTASAPRVLATLRNLAIGAIGAIGAIRLTGTHKITATMNWAANKMDRPFQLLHLS